ncbi:hypothetical protein ILYODFUR_031801 [Ilyodon furcidens]|uniref:MACPF domain-containing protein n=1 Tax=Ilyodon furcidens TaxID=33524 RepID=A0ABV0V7T8_9TELE
MNKTKKLNHDQEDKQKHDSKTVRTYKKKTETKQPQIITLNHEFDMAVKTLPPHSSGSAYRNFIDTYGTHCITQVFLGWEIKATTSIKTCEATINGLTATEVNDCLPVEAFVNFVCTASIEAM